jgi:hypothetical protein
MMSDATRYYGGQPTAFTQGELPIRGTEMFNVTFGDIPTRIKEQLNDSIISCTVNYGMDLVTEITVKVIDRDYRASLGKKQDVESFAAGNYFNIGRDVTYLSRTIAKSEFDDQSKVAGINLTHLLMEVAETSCDAEQGISPIWTIKCRPKRVQQMKRDKKPEVIEGNGTAYVAAACKKYGLKLVAEQTSKSKKITKASGENEADSVWDVIQNLAQQAKFKCFEVDNVLYFASMKWLMYKWGPDALTYIASVKDKETGNSTDRRVTRRYIPLVPGEVGRDYQTQKLPAMSRSDNSIMEAQGSAMVERTNGVGIRPGMTVFVGGIPTFVGYYLVTSVEFEERSPNPVGIQFQTPERKPKEKIYLPVGPMYPNTDDPVGPDVLVPFISRGQTLPVDTGKRRRPVIP